MLRNNKKQNFGPLKKQKQRLWLFHQILQPIHNAPELSAYAEKPNKIPNILKATQSG